MSLHASTGPLRRLQRLLRRHCHLSLHGRVPRGVDAWLEARKWLKTERPVIIDAGAHFGESVSALKFEWPKSRIFSFEPLPQAFGRLEEVARRHCDVQCDMTALSSRSGEAEILVGDDDSQASFVAHGRNLRPVPVRLRTLDQVASDVGIDVVDILKMDVEGHELEVVRGARCLFERGAISLVYSEMGFRRTDHVHTYLPDLQAELLPYGFELVGIYEQVTDRRGCLHFCNALYARI